MTGTKPKAFTLIEVLASVVILSGVIVALIFHSADGLSTNLEIQRKVKSALLAEGEMEKIKNTLRQSFDTDVTAWSSSLGDNYLVDRTVTDVNSTLKIIEISVGYDTDSSGTLETAEIRVTLTTQNAERS